MKTETAKIRNYMKQLDNKEITYKQYYDLIKDVPMTFLFNTVINYTNAKTRLETRLKIK